MPEPRGPLLQKKEEAESGGVGPKPTPAPPKSAVDNVMETVTGRNSLGKALNLVNPLRGNLVNIPVKAWEMTKSYEENAARQLEEGNPGKQEVVAAGSVGQVPSTVPPRGGTSEWNVKTLPNDPKAKTGKASGMRLVGRLVPDAPPEEAARRAVLEEKMLQKSIMEGYAHFKFGQVAQSTHENLAFLFANDADEAMRMVREEFPRFMESEKKFQKELDDIRTLRVNPYNYLQTAGKGGRAGESFGHNG